MLNAEGHFWEAAKFSDASSVQQNFVTIFSINIPLCCWTVFLHSLCLCPKSRRSKCFQRYGSWQRACSSLLAADKASRLFRSSVLHTSNFSSGKRLENVPTSGRPNTWKQKHTSIILLYNPHQNPCSLSYIPVLMFVRSLCVTWSLKTTASSAGRYCRPGQW